MAISLELIPETAADTDWHDYYRTAPETLAGRYLRKDIPYKFDQETAGVKFNIVDLSVMQSQDTKEQNRRRAEVQKILIAK